MKNKVMLITYADSLGKNLKELNELLQLHFKEAINSVHILPFYPSSQDRGFAPLTYHEVDKAFGNWRDIEKISENFTLMVDFMVNHISRSSVYFKDFIENKEQSPYKNLFIRYKDFYVNEEPTDEEIDLIYKRKPRAPYEIAEFIDGTKEKVWSTFGSEQIDLNVETETTKTFIKENLRFLSQYAKVIRLDAFAYAIKKRMSSCFFIEPEIWHLLHMCDEILKKEDVDLLPEIHEHYTIQLKIAEKGYYVYDFALPMLVLYTLYFSNNDRLIHWLKICPRKQFTTLDTHDGIGVVDVVDLMTQDEIEKTRDYLYQYGANVKKKYSSTEYNNLDIYQINCTYYSALGNDDEAYLLARAIQFFTPGIPQVYYVGLLAGTNDIELLEKTKNGRDINRHYYTKDEVKEQVERNIVKDLMKLMKFRNEYEAFNGEFMIDELVKRHELKLIWKKGDAETTLYANLSDYSFTIYYKENEKSISLF